MHARPIESPAGGRGAAWLCLDVAHNRRTKPFDGLRAMLTSPARKKGAQGPRRKAAPGNCKGKAKKPRHVANPGPTRAANACATMIESGWTGGEKVLADAISSNYGDVFAYSGAISHSRCSALIRTPCKSRVFRRSSGKETTVCTTCATKPPRCRIRSYASASNGSNDSRVTQPFVGECIQRSNCLPSQ